ncbi:hypothetical protein BRADI_4g04502v3 [Brachypodium distachyon]|uniref:Uncharacterized protein n=1 Tax=Brachypodium distachyon TaxID=15368 RepID=A0A0Q3HDM3_BRADI|nr:hypothetical protein BRADI_4g04502v3 [Brachypodium distachyon]
MTGNLHLLTNFTPTQPGRPGSDTHWRNAAGLAENIISVTQLTDSGFNVAFGPGGCTVTRNHDEERVGGALHAGGQFYRLHDLRVTPSKYPARPRRELWDGC